MPFAPAASAVRRIAPRLCGSSTPSRTTMSEYCARFGRDHVRQVVVLFRRRDGDDSLMRRVSGHTVEFGTLQKADGNTNLSAVFDQTLQAQVVTLFRHADPLEGASAGLERLGDGIDAVDVVHEVSVYRKTAKGVRRRIRNSRNPNPFAASRIICWMGNKELIDMLPAQ